MTGNKLTSANVSGGDRDVSRQEIDRLKRRVAELESAAEQREETPGDGRPTLAEQADYKTDSPHSGKPVSGHEFVPSKRAGDDLTLKGE